MRKNLLKCFYFALFGNIFFILFAIVCFIYYYAFGSIGVVVKSIEAIAYAFEGTGFVLNLVSAVYFFKMNASIFLNFLKIFTFLQ